VTVQRTFEVGAGNVPGVAIVVGAVVGLPMLSALNLFFAGTGNGYCAIGISSDDRAGRVAYSYEPHLVIAPQPLRSRGRDSGPARVSRWHAQPKT
jgi:hypothetical protein